MSDNTKDTTKDNDETPLFVPPDDIDTDNFFDDVELDELDELKELVDLADPPMPGPR